MSEDKLTDARKITTIIPSLLLYIFDSQRTGNYSGAVMAANAIHAIIIKGGEKPDKSAMSPDYFTKELLYGYYAKISELTRWGKIKWFLTFFCRYGNTKGIKYVGEEIIERDEKVPDYRILLDGREVRESIFTLQDWVDDYIARKYNKKDENELADGTIVNTRSEIRWVLAGLMDFIVMNLLPCIELGEAARSSPEALDAYKRPRE